MSRVNEEALAGLHEFARWHVSSGDVDPVYPVLAQIEGEVCRDDEEALALTLLYVAFYDLGSALTVWGEGWRPGRDLTDAQLHYRTGTERRSHRAIPAFQAHIAALNGLHGLYGSFTSYLRPIGGTPPAEAWVQLQAALRAIRGNGRWAAYKTGEILKTVHGWPLTITDAGHDFSTGPRHGLGLIFPEVRAPSGASPGVVHHLDKLTTWLCVELGLPVEQVETVLCDFHALADGRYYVGHDIDLMLEQLGRCDPSIGALITQARLESFDPMWLGEAQGALRGWPGVRSSLKRLYADEGRVQWWS